jgi:hypothetical protein
MNQTQLTTLKTAIFASVDPAVIAARQISDDTALAALYNLPSTYIVWKTSLTRIVAMSVGFDWTAVDNLTNGQARIWDYLFENDSRAMNPADSSQRDGLAECWKGNAAKLANQVSILALCKRDATEYEKVFASGTGTTLTPGTMTLTGAVTAQSISDALVKG